MSKTTAASTTEARVDGSGEAHVAAEAPGPRPSAATEADKIRRQMHLRRKIRLARRALAAHRR